MTSLYLATRTVPPKLQMTHLNTGKNHEQALADEFHDFMKDFAKESNRAFHRFSFDGQDREYGADYLLSSESRFAIVEFKWSANDLVSEKKKARRLKLCKSLPGHPEMRKLHDQCHFISWMEESGHVQTNIYRCEICNKAVFGPDCELVTKTALVDSRETARTFMVNFFDENGRKSLLLAEFQTYVDWLLVNTSDVVESSIELVTRDPKSADLILVRLNSFAAVQQWVIDHYKPSQVDEKKLRF